MDANAQSLTMAKINEPMRELAVVYGGTHDTLGKSMMAGVRTSQSKYIVRIDGDDVPSEYYLEYGLHLIKSLGIAVSPRYLIDRSWTFVDKPQGSGIFYEREKFLDVGGYDESLDYQADLDFYIRYTKKYPIHTAYGLIYYWKPGRSKTQSQQIKNARQLVLNRYGVKDNEVHHFGAYAYI